MIQISPRPATGLYPSLLRRRMMQALAVWPLAVPAGAHAAEPRFGALGRAAMVLREPQRAVLLAAALAGPRIVAVGERGVVALSDDGGVRWRQAQQVPCSVSLTALRFADERRGWAVGHGGVVLATQDGGDTWALQTDGIRLAAQALSAAEQGGDAAALKDARLLVADGPDKPLLDLHVDADGRRIVVVGAYNLCFESTDGGVSWAAALTRLDNPKNLHLYAVGVQGRSWLVAGEQGLLLSSQDGGRQFTRLASPYAGSWFALAPRGPGHWLVAGLRGHVFRSRDDGSTWEPLSGAAPASFVSALPTPNGVLLANQAGQLWLAADSGRLAPVPGPALPPLTQALPLPSGGVLALTVAGAKVLPGAPS